MKRWIATVILLSCLLSGALIQMSLLKPERGQAMAMPFITTIIWTIALAVIYSIAYYGDRYIKSTICRIIGIILQLVVIAYFTKQYLFYYNLENGNYPIDKWDSDYFPPGVENYYVIALFSIMISTYYFSKIFLKKKKVLLSIIVSCISLATFGQTKTVRINGHTFLIKKKVIKNEEGTKKDTLIQFFRLENGKEKYLLIHYLYKNEGGDCNNIFWDRGTYRIEKNKLILTTHHCQERNDPIIAWERQTYKVAKTGTLILIANENKRQNIKYWKPV